MLNNSLINRLTWNQLKTGTGSSTLQMSIINSSSNSYYKEFLISVHDSNLLYCYNFVVPSAELSSTTRYLRQGYYVSQAIMVLALLQYLCLQQLFRLI